MGGEVDQVRWRGVRPVQGISGIWPARNSTRIYEDVTKTGLGTEYFYQVPGDKKLFVATSVLTSYMSSANDSNIEVSVRTGADVHQFYLSRIFYTIAGFQAIPQYFRPAIEIQGDYYLRLYNNHADLRSWCLITGWLEDA